MLGVFAAVERWHTNVDGVGAFLFKLRVLDFEVDDGDGLAVFAERVHAHRRLNDAGGAAAAGNTEEEGALKVAAVIAAGDLDGRGTVHVDAGQRAERFLRRPCRAVGVATARRDDAFGVFVVAVTQRVPDDLAVELVELGGEFCKIVAFQAHGVVVVLFVQGGVFRHAHTSSSCRWASRTCFFLRSFAFFCLASMRTTRMMIVVMYGNM